MPSLSVIEFFDRSGEIIVTKIPYEGSGEFVLGTQLIVQESQVAVFYKDGRALDLFEAGRYTLLSDNLPILSNFYGLAFDGKSPFRSSVYFIATKTFINLGWGTPTPILYRDTDFHMVSLRAHGVYSIRIKDPHVFLQTIVGTRGLQTTFSIEEYFRSVIVSRFNEVLGQKMKSILDLPAQYSEIVLSVKQNVKSDFEQYGIELVDLIVEAITVPSEVQEMINRAAGIAVQDTEKYRAISAADAMLAAAKNQAGAGEVMGAGLGLGLGLETVKQISQNSHAVHQSPDQQNTHTALTTQEIKDRLKALKELKDEGILSDEEFEEQKKKLLAQM